MISVGEVFPRWYYSIPRDDFEKIRDFFANDIDGLYRYMYILFCDYTSGVNGNVVSIDIGDKREVDAFLSQLGITLDTVIENVPEWTISDFT
jgi:hypothetical protein